MRLIIAAMLMIGVAAPVWSDQDGLLVRFDASDPVQVNDGFFLYQEHRRVRFHEISTVTLALRLVGVTLQMTSTPKRKSNENL